MASWLPPGSEQIYRYALSRRLGFEATPGEDFFRRWEPHDTLVSPERYYNACTAPAPWGGHITVAEPWTCGEGLEPIERALIAFATADALHTRAAMRVGEPFLTRVAFLESPPPRTVTLSDAVWDEHVSSFADSPEEAVRGFPSGLRQMLQRRGFRGHLEMRPGGFVLHEAGRIPTPEHYDQLIAFAVEVGRARLQRA